MVKMEKKWLLPTCDGLRGGLRAAVRGAGSSRHGDGVGASWLHDEIMRRSQLMVLWLRCCGGKRDVDEGLRKGRRRERGRRGQKTRWPSPQLHSFVSGAGSTATTARVEAQDNKRTGLIKDDIGCSDAFLAFAHALTRLSSSDVCSDTQHPAPANARSAFAVLMSAMMNLHAPNDACWPPWYYGNATPFCSLTASSRPTPAVP